MSRPPFPGKPNGPIRPQQQHPVSAPHFTHFPPLSEMTPSVSNVGSQHANCNHLSVEVVEGDREEGEVSDVEMENAKWPSEKVDVEADGHLKARANGNTGNSNGKFVDKSHETLSGGAVPRKGASLLRYHDTGSSSPRTNAAESLTARISALNLREQSWYVFDESFPSLI